MKPKLYQIIPENNRQENIPSSVNPLKNRMVGQSSFLKIYKKVVGGLFLLLFSQVVLEGQTCYALNLLNDSQPITAPVEVCPNGDLSSISVAITPDFDVIDDLEGNCQYHDLFFEDPDGVIVSIEEDLELSNGMAPVSLPVDQVMEGEYTVTLQPDNTNSCDCETITATFTIEINDLGLTVVAQPNENTCTTGEFDLIATTDCEDCDYVWTGPDVVQVNSNTTTGNGAGFYYVVITDGNNCSVTANVSVPKFYYNFQIEAGLDTALTCDDPSITLNGSVIDNIPNDSLSYQWSGPSVTSGETTLTPTVNAAGTYTLQVTYNWSGCVATDDVEVAAAQELPVADIIDEGAPTEINCLLTEIVLGGGATTTEDVNYKWYLNATGPIPNESDITYTVDGPGQYSLVVTSTLDPSCSASDWVEITENTTPPSFQLNPQDIVFCQGESEIVSVSPDTFSLEWSNGATGTFIEVDEAGDYFVIATDTNNGCKDTADFAVFVEYPPDLSDMDRTYVLEEDASETIDISPGDGFWQLTDWVNVEGLSLDGAEQSPIEIDGFTLTSGVALGAVKYDVWALSENSQCPSDTIEILVKVFKATEDLYIPEVITPNGDGQNETWDILFPTEQAANMAEIIVYNRSGGIEFKKEARDIYTPWDAIGCPDGEFFYYIISDNKTYKGALLILRKRE